MDIKNEKKVNHQKRPNRWIFQQFMEHTAVDKMLYQGEMASQLLPEKIATLATDARRNMLQLMYSYMSDPLDRAAIESANMARFGDCCGPTFEYLMSRANQAGFVGDDGYRHIVELLVKQHTVPELGRLKMEIRNFPAAEVREYQQERTIWEATARPLEPWRGDLSGMPATIRVNAFPEEHLYTLVINGAAVGDFDDWPRLWIRPKFQP